MAPTLCVRWFARGVRTGVRCCDLGFWWFGGCGCALGVRWVCAHKCAVEYWFSDMPDDGP